jgi:predicted ArsR family transcriptional regulator
MESEMNAQSLATRLLDTYAHRAPFTAKAAAKKFDVSPTTVRGRISELKNNGFFVKSTTRRYRRRNISVYYL